MLVQVLVQTYISYYMYMTVHVTANVFTASLGPCVPRVSRAAPECVVGGARPWWAAGGVWEACLVRASSLPGAERC